MTTYIYKRQSELPESLDDFCGELKPPKETKIAISKQEIIPCFVAGSFFLFSTPFIGYLAYVNSGRNQEYLTIFNSLSAIEMFTLGMFQVLSARKGYLTENSSFLVKLSELTIRVYESTFKKTKKD